MLASSRAAVLLIQAGLAGRLPPSAAVSLLLDAEWSALAGGPADEPPTYALSPHNLAYVIYTWGSTGLSKGMMMSQHGSLGSYIATALEAYGMELADRVLQFCSISFDISPRRSSPASHASPSWGFAPRR